MKRQKETKRGKERQKRQQKTKKCIEIQKKT